MDENDDDDVSDTAVTVVEKEETQDTSYVGVVDKLWQAQDVEDFDRLLGNYYRMIPEAYVPRAWLAKEHIWDGCKHHV